MNKRRRMMGVVTSNKMMKSVTVRLSHSYRHPLYKKVIHTSRSILVHDELGCKVGDKVQLVEGRPVSKRISWVVEKIVKKEEKTVTVDASVEIEASTSKKSAEDMSESTEVSEDEQTAAPSEEAGEPA